MSTKVSLRKKNISNKRKSLYLDFYPAVQNPQTGKPTRREFLGLYVFEKANNPFDRQHNKETLELAEQIRQKREMQINKPEIYTDFELEQLRKKELGEKNFVEYFKELADKRKTSNHDNWISAYNYLLAFTKGYVKFADVNEKLCNEFKEYLLNAKSNRSNKTNLSQNSASSYFNKLKAALKQAYKDGYFNIDLNSKIECVEVTDVLKQTLTLEELNLLARTECKNPLLKKVVLFYNDNLHDRRLSRPAYFD